MSCHVTSCRAVPYVTNSRNGVLQMFGPDAPPIEWDTGGEYKRERVELYYLTHAGHPLSEQQLIHAYKVRGGGRDTAFLHTNKRHPRLLSDFCVSCCSAAHA